MSLDRLVRKTTRSRVRDEAELYLPPEYEIDLEGWKKLVLDFNKTTRPVRLAGIVMQFVRDRNPDKTDFSQLVAIDEIVERDGNFFTKLSFENDRGGLTALVAYEAEKLRLVPVCLDLKGENGISHISLTYTPS